jgi:hypothetical protein
MVKESGQTLNVFSRFTYLPPDGDAVRIASSSLLAPSKSVIDISYVDRMRHAVCRRVPRKECRRRGLAQRVQSYCGGGLSAN